MSNPASAAATQETPWIKYYTLHETLLPENEPKYENSSTATKICVAAGRALGNFVKSIANVFISIPNAIVWIGRKICCCSPKRESKSSVATGAETQKIDYTNYSGTIASLTPRSATESEESDGDTSSKLRSSTEVTPHIEFQEVSPNELFDDKHSTGSTSGQETPRSAIRPISPHGSGAPLTSGDRNYTSGPVDTVFDTNSGGSPVVSPRENGIPICGGDDVGVSNREHTTAQTNFSPTQSKTDLVALPALIGPASSSVESNSGTENTQHSNFVLVDPSSHTTALDDSDLEDAFDELMKQEAGLLPQPNVAKRSQAPSASSPPETIYLITDHEGPTHLISPGVISPSSRGSSVISHRSFRTRVPQHFTFDVLAKETTSGPNTNSQHVSEAVQDDSRISGEPEDKQNVIPDPKVSEAGETNFLETPGFQEETTETGTFATMPQKNEGMGAGSTQWPLNIPNAVIQNIEFNQHVPDEDESEGSLGNSLQDHIPTPIPSPRDIPGPSTAFSQNKSIFPIYGGFPSTETPVADFFIKLPPSPTDTPVALQSQLEDTPEPVESPRGVPSPELEIAVHSTFEEPATLSSPLLSQGALSPYLNPNPELWGGRPRSRSVDFPSIPNRPTSPGAFSENDAEEREADLIRKKMYNLAMWMELQNVREAHSQISDVKIEEASLPEDPSFPLSLNSEQLIEDDLEEEMIELTPRSAALLAAEDEL